MFISRWPRSNKNNQAMLSKSKNSSRTPWCSTRSARSQTMLSTWRSCAPASLVSSSWAPLATSSSLSSSQSTTLSCPERERESDHAWRQLNRNYSQRVCNHSLCTTKSHKLEQNLHLTTLRSFYHPFKQETFGRVFCQVFMATDCLLDSESNSMHLSTVLVSIEIWPILFYFRR